MLPRRHCPKAPENPNWHLAWEHCEGKGRSKPPGASQGVARTLTQRARDGTETHSARQRGEPPPPPLRRLEAERQLVQELTVPFLPIWSAQGFRLCLQPVRRSRSRNAVWTMLWISPTLQLPKETEADKTRQQLHGKQGHTSRIQQVQKSAYRFWSLTAAVQGWPRVVRVSWYH